MSAQARALAAALVAIKSAPTSCIPWSGRIDAEGYGRHGGGLAHRKVYALVTGQELPSAVLLDHLCHTPSCSGGPACPHRSCVNPSHLTPASHKENVLRGSGPTAVNARKTACDKGHDFTPENTYITTSGGRRCRMCGNAASRAYAARQREAC